MARPNDLELGAAEIVAAAVEILQEQGLDALSMRTVSSRLGVSPVPVYNRVGNKDALLDAVAAHLFADVAPPVREGEPWTEYADRWCHELRRRLLDAPEPRLILGARRNAYVEASRSLVAAMRADGLDPDRAVQACRLLMYGTIGFVAMSAGPTLPSPSGREGHLPGSDPEGVTVEELDALFDLQVRSLISGLLDCWRRDDAAG